MTELSKPIQAGGGSCCGGGAAKAKPQAKPADNVAPAPVGNTKPKPAAASGGCCG